MYHLGTAYTRSFTSTALKHLSRFNSRVTAPFPVISTCPSPTCTCADTPPNLDIERSKPLDGTTAQYAQHVLISTGKTDWPSKIENEKEEPWGLFAADLKKAVGPRGQFHDPYKNILVSTSSFPTTENSNSVLLFPSFRNIQSMPQGEEPLNKFIQNHLLQSSSTSSSETYTTAITRPTILICSHASRDSRCGILGPILHSEFTRQVQLSNISFTPNIGCISHIGGHAWAGNVIIYIPPTWRTGEDKAGVSPLAGMGIWYGRVEPKHVEGIIKETILGGRVIGEMFRGGIDLEGKPLRL